MQQVPDLKEKHLIRESGIELLKVVAVFLIVLSHVIQTLSSSPTYYPSKEYVLNITRSTTQWRQLILSMLRYSGSIGNTIFFISSAWFLIGRRKNDKRKVLQLFLDNWLIAFLILLSFLALTVTLDRRLIVKSLFPVISGNNWYIICYMLFLLVYPFLNDFIEHLNRKMLARVSSFLFILYIVVIFSLRVFNKKIGATSFFSSDLIVWIAIYFMLSYMKKYEMKWMDSANINWKLVLIGFIGTYGLVALTNAVGLKYKGYNNMLLVWNGNTNHPFIIMMILGLFNLVRKLSFKSRLVNYLSGLTLYVYLIHDNVLVKNITRPAIWQHIYENVGHRFTVKYTILIAVMLFIASCICSIIYKHTFHKGIEKTAGWLYPRLAGQYGRLEKWFLEL